MDLQLTLWILVFVGGYVAALAYLLRVAMRKDPGRAPDAAGRDE